MKKNTIVDFNVRLHTIGRIWISFGTLLIMAVPVVIGVYFQVMPDWTVFASAAVIGPMILNLAAGIAEPIIYSPMLGTNGEYLAFMTGNLSNLKIPCVVKAQEIVGTKTGTEENELVSTIAIATSSLVTALIVVIAVLCLAFSGLTTTIQQNAFIFPAFGCVVYALFGSLGGKYMAKNPKLAIFPGIAVVALSAIFGILKVKLGSVSLFIGIACCLLFAVFQYTREKKKMQQKEELKRLEAIAAGMSYEHILEIDKNQKEDELAEKKKHS